MTSTFPSRVSDPDPKPERRHRADSLEWRRIRLAHKGSGCRVCREPWDSLHHLYPRGQGGDDCYENMVPLCGSGTSGCHGLVEAHDPVARAAVRYSLSDQNKWYLTYKLGHRAAGWLDAQYPELGI